VQRARGQAAGASLLLPQINLGGQVYTANADGESTFPQVEPGHGQHRHGRYKSSTDVSQYWDYRAELTQTVFRGTSGRN